VEKKSDDEEEKDNGNGGKRGSGGRVGEPVGNYNGTQGCGSQVCVPFVFGEGSGGYVCHGCCLCQVKK
jgi:hypothetical protein